MLDCYKNKTSELMPLYYYGRSKKKSDLEWVLRMLMVVPDKHRQKICDKYESLYRNPMGNRKAANTYLYRVARFFNATNKR